MQRIKNEARIEIYQYQWHFNAQSIKSCIILKFTSGSSEVDRMGKYTVTDVFKSDVSQCLIK